MKKPWFSGGGAARPVTSLSLRTTEKGKPVDAIGEIIDSGDPISDGPVEDALDMIAKLAESEQV